MRRIAPALLLLLAAALAVGEENAGPLSESKQQLKQLQKDQDARDRSATGSELKGLIPGISMPSSTGGDLPAPPPSALRPEDRGEKSSPRSANWLLEGYDKLGAASGKLEKRGRSARDNGVAKETDDEHGLFPSAEQKPAGRSAAAQGGRAALKSTRAPDPMEPFLKAWLANSPVRDAIFSARESAKRSESEFDLFDRAANPSHEPGRPSTPTTTATFESTLSPKPENPYLQALNASRPVTPASLASQVSTPASAILSQGSAGLAAAAPTSTGATKNNSFKGPVTPAQDDKKYFPQLKRF